MKNCSELKVTYHGYFMIHNLDLTHNPIEYSTTWNWKSGVGLIT